MKRMYSTAFTLVELLISVALTAVMMLGMVHAVSLSLQVSVAQDRQAEVQQRLQATVSLLSRRIREAGFDPTPWVEEQAIINAFVGSVEGGRGSDQLMVQSRSDLNCFGHRNTHQDEKGKALFFLRRDQFSLTRQGQLAHACWYGADEVSLVRQIRRQGRIAGIKNFQLKYGLDSNSNGQVDVWQDFSPQLNGKQIRGVRSQITFALPADWPHQADNFPRLLQLHTAVRGVSG